MTTIGFTPHGILLDPTSLHDVPGLARLTGVSRVLVKDEGERPFGNFKILGGMTAGLLALARATGVGVDEIAHRQSGFAKLPKLICASDGNHGLAVAAAAQTAGASATIFLHEGVGAARAERIKALGANIAWTSGTYDDAVRAARAAASREEGLLVPDTSADPNDVAVRDVMRGYRILVEELVRQLTAVADAPTHLFVQAGVGGLAAAITKGLADKLADPVRTAVVEPAKAACVAQALEIGRIERFKGDLHTRAEMLSCGEASAPALAILSRQNAMGVPVSEARIEDAARIMAESGFMTTPSGACGLAGLLEVAENIEMRERCGLTSNSVVLLFITERG